MQWKDDTTLRSRGLSRSEAKIYGQNRSGRPCLPYFPSGPPPPYVTRQGLAAPALLCSSTTAGAMYPLPPRAAQKQPWELDLGQQSWHSASRRYPTE